jgi:hypothetical protein
MSNRVDTAARNCRLPSAAAKHSAAGNPHLKQPPSASAAWSLSAISPSNSGNLAMYVAASGAARSGSGTSDSTATSSSSTIMPTSRARMATCATSGGKVQQS